MAKILKIENEVIVIGKDDGSLTEVRAVDLNFVPVVGDEVEVFQSETKVIVSKKEKEIESKTTNDGINISINNANNNIVPEQVYIANGKKAVNKVVYCLLAFFLGSFGIHKFYAGKIGMGIVYLVLCWTFIPGFIAFIEFLVALFKKADVNGNILV